MSSDVGILNAGAAGKHGGDNANNNDEGPNNITSTRLDVHSALYDACYRGDCCAYGKADGTSNIIPSLPTTLGLHVQGAGILPIPMIEEKEEVLKAVAQKDEDEQHHNVFQIDSKKITINNPAWDSSLDKLVRHVAFKLGLDPDSLSAELEWLLFMEKGSRVDWCANVEGEDENEEDEEEEDDDDTPNLGVLGWRGQAIQQFMPFPLRILL